MSSQSDRNAGFETTSSSVLVKFYVLPCALVLTAWAAVALWVVPAVIRSAYRGASIGPVNRLIEGQAQHPVEYYLDQWGSLVLPGTVAILALCVLACGWLWAVRSAEGRHLLERWTAWLPEGPRISAIETMVFAAALGLMAGFSESLFLFGRRFVFGRITIREANDDVFWLAPLAALLALLVVGLLIQVIRPAGRLGSARVMSWILVAFATNGAIVIWLPRMYPWAAALLALGIGWRVSGLVARRTELYVSRAKWATVLMLALVGVIGTGTRGGGWLSERIARAGRPSAPEGAPNVLLLFLDTVRARSLGVYGYERETTPGLSELAETSAVFGNAIATSSWTLPGHASVFTGRYGRELSVGWYSPLDDTYPTLGEALGQRGYRTAGFVANLIYGSRAFGLARGFDRYRANPLTFGALMGSSKLTDRRYIRLRSRLGIRRLPVRKTAADINREFLGWVGSGDGRPFFAFLNYFDAHGPYLPPPTHRRRFSMPNEMYRPAAGMGRKYTEKELDQLRNTYDETIAYLDGELGHLFEELRRRDLFDNTLIIVVGDHGEEFAEHGLISHGNSLYMASLQVPLILRPPGGLRGRRDIEIPISLVDVPNTVLDALEGTTPFPGNSLAVFWGEDGELDDARLSPAISELDYSPNNPDWYPVSAGDMRSIMIGDLRYIENADGTPEVYDLRADPWEQNDLSETDVGRRLIPEARRIMDSYHGRTNGG